MDLAERSKKVRELVVTMAHESKSAHLGPALSCADILVCLYFWTMKDEDRFILSKGHGCMSYYAVLAEKGILDPAHLKTYSKNGGLLAEHPSSNIPGVDVETGSLGHGLSIAVGAAIARKIKGKAGKEYVLLGDGECNEGTVWEAASFAAHRQLDNLIAIVDHNKFQATDRCSSVNNINLVNVWEAFGWDVIRIDGNNLRHLKYALGKAQFQTKPVVIIADTIKGKGVSFAENDLEWHYRVPNKEELEKAIQEIRNAELIL